MLEQYRRYLTVERGLTAGTARGYVDIVRPFVESRVNAVGEVELWDLSPADVLGFLLAESAVAVAEVGEAAGQRVAVVAWVLARRRA